MVIKKDGYLQDKLTRACYRMAQYMHLEIKEKDDRFTLKEALDDSEDYWFNKKTMDKDAFTEFIIMCSSYSSIGDRPKLPVGIYVFKIDCPNCHRCIMTKEQVELNSIDLFEKKYMICINCGEIMELAS